MKKIGALLVMLSLGLFSVGCGDTTEPKKDPPKPAAGSGGEKKPEDAGKDPAQGSEKKDDAGANGEKTDG